MTESDLRTHATEIHEQFSDQLEIDVDDVIERLDTLVNDYRSPSVSPRRSVVNTYLDEAAWTAIQLGAAMAAATSR